MLTQGLSLRSSRVGYARVSRTRPTRRPTTSFISPSAILNRKPGTMRLLRGPPLGLTTTMVLLSREITSPAPPAVPSAKVPWPLRLRSLLRVLEATKPVLGREVPSVPTQPRVFMPPSSPHRLRNVRGQFTIQRIHLFQHPQG